MMQRFLFPSVAVPSEVDVNKLLGPVFPHLWWCSNEPFRQFKLAQTADADYRSYESGDIAQWMWPKVIRRARFICETFFDLVEVKVSGKPAFRFRDNLILVFKKLTWRRQKDWEGGLPPGSRRLCRSNYKTSKNELFWAQGLNAEFPDLPRVIVGTILEKEATRVRTVVGVPVPRKTYMDWFFTIPDQSARLKQIFKVPKKDLASEQERRGYTIIPVEKKEERGAQ